MNLNRSIFLVILFNLISIIVFAQEVGKPAPLFTVDDSQGKEQSLTDYQGKYVVLEWYNPECPFVVKHYSSNNMQALQKKYTDLGIIWLSISSSASGKQGYLTPEAANKLLKESNAHASALLLDHDGKVGKAYGAKTTPHMFIIDPKGILVYAGAIDSTNSTDSDDIKNSVNYVAQALDQALAGKPISEPSTDPYGCSVKYASLGWLFG